MKRFTQNFTKKMFLDGIAVTIDTQFDLSSQCWLVAFDCSEEYGKRSLLTCFEKESVPPYSLYGDILPQYIIEIALYQLGKAGGFAKLAVPRQRGEVLARIDLSENPPDANA